MVYIEYMGIGPTPLEAVDQLTEFVTTLYEVHIAHGDRTYSSGGSRSTD